MDEKRISQQEKILTAAYDLICAQGYANVSIRDVAKKADVVLSQVNYYFGNKEGLFTEVFKTMIDNYLVEVESILAKGNTTKEKMSLLVHFFKNLLISSPELLKIFYDFSTMSIWSEAFGKQSNELFGRLADIIRRNIVENSSELRNRRIFSSEGVSRMILGALMGIMLQFLNKPDYELLNESMDSLQILIN